MLGLAPDEADAQSLGTFRWQLQPYCNVLTVVVTQVGSVYRVEGTDDQCGAATSASVIGTAFQNPNGSIGFGLNVVAAPGGIAAPIDATIALATLSGTWRDSGGGSGTFAFTPGAGTGGSPRPAPTAAVPAAIRLLTDGGLVAGGQLDLGTIPAVGAGTRMMWHPRKAAFRAGKVTGSHWDETKVGFFSSAFGYNTEASGFAAVAMGNGAAALGDDSVALGPFALASGNGSVALGSVDRRQQFRGLRHRAPDPGQRGTQHGDGPQHDGERHRLDGAGDAHDGERQLQPGHGLWHARPGRSASPAGRTARRWAIPRWRSAWRPRPAGSAASCSDAPPAPPRPARARSCSPTDRRRRRSSRTRPTSSGRGSPAASTSTPRPTCPPAPRWLPSGSSWAALSDVNAKENFRDVDGEDLLAKLSRDPVREWNYKAQDTDIRHMGPTAQDFRAAFGLGDFPLRINTIDADGVALAGVKALDTRTSALRATVDDLRRANDELRARLARLEAVLDGK